MKLIDAHHHYWDLLANNHPWLCEEPRIPFRYGDYTAICKESQPLFMPDDYDRVTGEWHIDASVTMEGEWTPDDPTGEAVWMQKLADDSGRPAAHVAQAWLDHADINETLAAYRQMPIVKSVRHKPRANARPGGPPGGMTDAAFREGFQRLGDAGLMFDLQTPWWHFHEAIEMSQLSPHTNIIINHTGMPVDRSAEGIAGWQRALTEIAALPNTYLKISGLGIRDKPWRLEDNYEIIRSATETFGAERCMFASNFPVDGLCGSFDTIYSGFKAATSKDSPATQEALFFRTAAEVYGIDVATL